MVTADVREAGRGLGRLRATRLERCAAGKANVVPPARITHRANALSFEKAGTSL